MNIETSTLTGNALNWAVNDAEQLTGVFAPVDYCGKWEFGGPIIEREGIALRAYDHNVQKWSAEPSINTVQTQLPAFRTGPTPLIAAMRCYVASQFGDTVDIPEELT
jgi:hypothetical protein